MWWVACVFPELGRCTCLVIHMYVYAFYDFYSGCLELPCPIVFKYLQMSATFVRQHGCHTRCASVVEVVPKRWTSGLNCFGSFKAGRHSKRSHMLWKWETSHSKCDTMTWYKSQKWERCELGFEQHNCDQSCFRQLWTWHTSANGCKINARWDRLRLEVVRIG